MTEKDKIIAKYCSGCYVKFLSNWDFQVCIPACLRGERRVRKIRAELRKYDKEIILDPSLTKEEKAFQVGIGLNALRHRIERAKKRGELI